MVKCDSSTTPDEPDSNCVWFLLCCETVEDGNLRWCRLYRVAMLRSSFVSDELQLSIWKASNELETFIGL